MVRPERELQGIAAMGALSENLRFLCARYTSISEACRRMGINRQQFNKYLSGQIAPAAGVLRRIGDHFGLDEAELRLSHDEFRALFGRVSLARKPRALQRLVRHFDDLQSRCDPRLADYTGYYAAYFPSFSMPGKVLRSLVHIAQADGIGVYKSVERLRPAGGGRSTIFKYEGAVFFLRERIFFMARETTAGHELVHAVLYPSYGQTIGCLFGLVLGASARPTREPVAARLALEYLGKRVARRAEMRRCDVYDWGDKRLPPRVVTWLAPDGPESGSLRARMG